jgi:signal transduction histidine kinase
MTRMVFFTAALILTLGCATAHTPRENTREAIVAYVDQAAELIRTSGPACDTLAGPAWFAGDWYVFVFDSEGKTVCHPARPAMVGTPAADLVDSNGKRFGEEMLRVATAGGGWVEYMWPRPGGTTPEAKSAYVRAATGPDGQRYVVGSGGYPR